MRFITVGVLGCLLLTSCAHLHGSGDTVANNVDVLRIFAQAGYVAMDIEYREARQGSIDLADIHTSLEFLNGSRYVRRGVIALNGFSLGGRMALRVAAHAKVLRRLTHQSAVERGLRPSPRILP